VSRFKTLNNMRFAKYKLREAIHKVKRTHFYISGERLGNMAYKSYLYAFILFRCGKMLQIEKAGLKIHWLNQISGYQV